MQSIQPDSDCTHVWRQTGYWDGKDTGTERAVAGPTGECTKCRGTMYITWEEWRELAEEQRIPIPLHGG